MTENTFGTVLADARKRQGLSVDDIAARLHIRRDIVMSIERSDLNSMPPSTYARTMIRHYAEIVGVDPGRIANLYDNAEYSTRLRETRSQNDRLAQAGDWARQSASQTDSDHYRVRPARNSASTRLGSPHTYRDDSSLTLNRSPMSNAYSTLRPAASRNPAPPQFASPGFSSFRINADELDEPSADAAMHSSPRMASRRTQQQPEGERSASRRTRSGSADTGRIRRSRGARTESEANEAADAASASASASAGRRSRERSPRSSAPRGLNPPGIYAAPSSMLVRQQSRTSKLVPLIAIAAIVLIVVFLVLFLRGCGKEEATEQTTTTPITGLADTDTSSGTTTDAIVAPVAPTSVQFAYKVKSDVETYIEIYLDDSETAAMAETVTGPSKGSYDVTGKLRFVCTAPDGVTITLDGTEVAMTPNEETSWLYEYEVDFTEYLANWQKEHASEIAAAEKAKAALEATQSSSPQASSSGSSSANSSSGKTVTTTN